MKVLDISTNVGGKLKTTDSQSGYRAYGRRAIEAIQIGNQDMSAGSEILLQLQKRQLKVAEIPIDVRYDLEKTSSEHPVTHGVGVLGSIIRLIAEERPLLFIGVPGLAFIFFGFFYGLLLLQLFNESGYFSLPLTMLAGFFIIIGVLGVFVAVMLNVLLRVIKEWERR